MDLEETPEQAAFRAEARMWLDQHGAARGAETMSVLNEPVGSDQLGDARRWQSLKAEAGWAGITWPRVYGGREATPAHQLIWDQEESRFHTPPDPFFVGIAVCGPTLIAHGTDDQKSRYLPALLRGDEIWCQLFSEPEAGSDLAAVRTEAVRQCHGWLMNGQKVWTSFAEHAQYGLALARTDWTKPKHRGLTLFIVDMAAPGVEVRPIRQVTGRAAFNEVFLTDVSVDDSMRVGDVGDGWRTAMSALTSERAGVSGGEYRTISFRQIWDVAMEGGSICSPALRQELAEYRVLLDALKYTGYRVQTTLSTGGQPGPEASIGKLVVSLVTQRMCNLALEVQGVMGLSTEGRSGITSPWATAFLEAPALRLVSGTDEIQRNIIAERVLGLPAEARPDKDIPFAAAAHVAAMSARKD